MSDPVYISEIFSSIQGEGMLAGRRQIFVRLMECNLDCRYCDTDFAKSDICRLESKPGSGSFLNLPQPLPLNKITSLFDDWRLQLPGAHHSVSFTGGEPLLYAETLTEWFPEIRKSLPIHLETNGTMHLALRHVKQHLDYISMDMKLPSTAGCKEYLWDQHALFLHEAHGSNVSVKIVVGESTPDSEIQQVCDIISEVDEALPLFLQPMSLPDGTVGIAAAHILHLQEIASSRLPDVRVIPQMHNMLGAL
ncbi:MAG: 7-carboxy-7-deazaguanine synthase QueE [Desulfuromonadaceae bacterium]|nr:7-carboxy-7-deazaguanine synthase QueE [Desulfuromonadaceae bacterium]MDD2847874.1 7-carboxy-7-deazaguanine synthase QueE [Desulfuromonadaceae bacterium]MDD4129581.1 7-carboxy-7-deazaguanine synthase QueE [Desulfuromonadaceae bacterium]